MHQKIILRNINKPKEANVVKDIDWLCSSFGFNAGRDTEKITTQIVKSLLKEVVQEGYTLTEDIANDIDIAAQRVNYHIRSIANSGFIFRKNKLIFLREGSVKASVEEIRKDANRIFDKLSLIANEIDVTLGLQNR